MIPSITHRQRTLLLFTSACCYTAWLTDVGERSDARDAARIDVPAVSERRSPPPDVSRVIRRDPFAGVPENRNAAGGRSLLPDANESAAIPVLGDAESNGRALLVPNIGALPSDLSARSLNVERADPGERGAGDVVRAIVVGTPSLAYVQTVEGLRLVRRGDDLEGRTVVAVDLHGVTLSDGTRIRLLERASATRAPHRRASLGESIDALRAAVERLSTSASPAPGATPQSIPSPAPSTQAIVTPGPLPTIVPNPLPVGVSPTADAYGPTPFPVPQIHSYPHSE